MLSLGAFEKLRKATISFIMSVRQSVRMEQLGSQWTDFYENLSTVRKYVEKIQVSLKSYKNSGHFHMMTNTNVWSHLAHVFFECENFRTKIVEKIKIHILCSVTFFLRKPCRLWDNVEKYGTAGQATDYNIVWHMRVACWIPKATNTPSEYVHSMFSTTAVTRMRYVITSYYTARLVPH